MLVCQQKEERASTYQLEERKEEMRGMKKSMTKGKSLTKKQKMIAGMAPPFNKITGADFKKLKKKRTRTA
jgi:hypothetical protein